MVPHSILTRIQFPVLLCARANRSDYQPSVLNHGHVRLIPEWVPLRRHLHLHKPFMLSILHTFHSDVLSSPTLGLPVSNVFIASLHDPGHKQWIEPRQKQEACFRQNQRVQFKAIHLAKALLHGSKLPHPQTQNGAVATGVNFGVLSQDYL